MRDTVSTNPFNILRRTIKKRKVYQPPEGLLFWLDASNHLLETQSYPGMVDASFSDFSDLPDQGEWEL